VSINRVNKIINIFIVLIILFLIVFVVQTIRYDKTDYNCCHMSRDEEKWLEEKGFDVKIARAKNFSGEEGHMWIVLNFFGFYINIDSIYLVPIFPPENTEYFESYEEYANK